MALYKYHAVANGLGTDHPVPGLAFVDDSHIPLDDPAAIEAVGRRGGTDTWGREDRIRQHGGWVAFTTDPVRHDLAWCVRWHPEHGRSVLLYQDQDAASVHTELWGPTLLFRSGGYWWDGTTWYRPAQIWDSAGEEPYRRPVPAAVTVTAAHMLGSGGGDPARGRILAVSDVTVDAPHAGRWLDDLALWAQHREGGRPLTDSVVQLTAPELTGDQLVGITEMAAIAEIAPSTLRAYIARGEAEVPFPQATVNGRSVWARPVAEEWAESRHRSPESVTKAVSTERAGATVPVGIADIWERFGQMFFTHLWDRLPIRRRWALRWRNEEAVREVAEALGWEVAAGIRNLIPVHALAATIQLAVLDEFTTGQQLHHQISGGKLHLANPADDSNETFYGIAHTVAQMLDWLIRHDPAAATSTIGTIIGDAERRLGIPRDISEHSLATALSLDGKLDQALREQFFRRVLTPSADSATT